MRTRKFSRLIAGVLLFLSFGVLLSPNRGALAAQPEGLARVAIQMVSERSGVPQESLRVVNRAPANYPLQGATVLQFKLESTADGSAYGIALDARGQAVDMAALDAAEQAAYSARYGRLEPALAERLANAPENQGVDVAIWLREPAYTGPARPVPGSNALATEQATQAYFAQVDAQRAAFVAPLVAPVMARMTELGLKPTSEAYSPVLFASLSPAAIRTVAAWDEVDRIYLSPTNTSDMEVARQTINAHTVNSRGYTGSGVQVAQIEVGGRIATGNPYLSGVVQNTTYVCSSASSHSTGVAGIIRSTHGTVKGIAYGASLWAGGSCSGSSSELLNRSTAAADWGARALNLSWGSDVNLVPGSNDRFYDDMIINRYRTVVKSAGNQGATDGDVTSPGLAYNLITVGNFDDRNSTTWSGDLMSSSSSWRDPISNSGDREKPEMSAPGTTINSTTTASPWTGAIGSGTSFAAPMVTGGAALLMQRSSSLTSWPEAVKAILMATSVHNIEGSTRLSEYDGAGAIVLDRADDVARGVNGTWGAQSYTCSTASTLNVGTMSLTSGVRTRVVIAWDTDDSYSSYSTKPGADLDLKILNSSGTVVASSSSYDNTYEIVEYTPSSSGTYTIQVYKYRCDYNPQWLGWAWYRGN